MKKTITLFILLFFIVSFISCVTLRLENRLKKLSPAIAVWYEIHNILMETKIPRWIDDRGGREKTHFLRLPQEMQFAYMKMFWEMRMEGLREEYYTRLITANRLFDSEGKAGWKTHRGRVLILCGIPQYKRYVTIYDMAMQNRGNPDWQQPQYSNEGYVYEIWEYYQQGCLVRYIFKYSAPDTWRGDYLSLYSTGEQARLEKQCRELFAPTKNGWDLWGNILLQWVRENE